MKKAVRLFSAVMYIAVVAAAALIIYYNVRLPDKYYVTKGGTLEFQGDVSILAAVNYPSGDSDETAAGFSTDSSGDIRSASLRLFGVIPIKNVDVCEVDEAAVVPCGTPFGIKMLTDGVMVVDINSFECGGELVSPASDAGIRPGDVVVSISGKKITCTEDITDVLAEGSGRTAGVKIIRDGVQSVVFIRPEISEEDGLYHAGMWVRDSSAGIGTLTFYDPSTGSFAGLGHPVCDVDTGEILPLCSGEAVDVIISGVKKGEAGSPGELKGSFISDKAAGTLDLNCEDGLYGRLDKSPCFAPAVPVAMRQEVSEGEAVIYSTIGGTSPKEYKVRIDKINLDGGEDSRDMVITVTDEELISEAGGIVQGMSGSPIIQNGKLVGAVTHVFVNDPKKGYGIFADSMYMRMKETENISADAAA